MRDEELAVESINKLFMKFALPAVVGCIIGGVQTIIDGYFIGNVVGRLGLASLTLSYPLLIGVIAVAMLMGTGCAALVALELGKGNQKQAHKIASNLIPMMLAAGLLFAFIGILFTGPLLKLAGATDLVFDMANDYLKIMFLGSIFPIMGICLDPLVRNDGRPSFAMKMMIMSAVNNMILDYLFVMKWGMGMQGAAIATVMAFGASAIVYILYFFSGYARLRLHLSDISIDPKIISGISRTGFPAFVMMLSLAVLVLSYNHILLKYGSEVAVSSYGIIEYTFSIFYMIFEGISAGAQPIIGFNYGAKLYNRVYSILKLATTSCVIVGFLGFMLIYKFPENIVNFFNSNDPKLLETAVAGIRIFMFGILFEGIIIMAAVYYQSVNKVNAALFIQLGKIFVFILPLLFILPLYLGLTGAWMAAPIGNSIMFSVVAFMLVREAKFLKNPHY